MIWSARFPGQSWYEQNMEHVGSSVLEASWTGQPVNVQRLERTEAGGAQQPGPPGHPEELRLEACGLTECPKLVVR